MEPGRYNFNIQKGATKRLSFRLTDGNREPIDFTGRVGRIYLKRTAQLSSPLLVEAEVTFAADGRVTGLFTKDQVNSLTGQGYWQFDITTGPDTDAILVGTWLVQEGGIPA